LTIAVDERGALSFVYASVLSVGRDSVAGKAVRADEDVVSVDVADKVTATAETPVFGTPPAPATWKETVSPAATTSVPARYGEVSGV
jgi:hypothetical protein